MQVAVTNPRLVQSAQHEDDENYFVSLYGSERVAEQKISPTSESLSGGTTVFSFQPPSTGTIMDKCVLLEVNVDLTFDADPAGNFPAPRAWPVNSAIQTLQVTINGTTITSSPTQRKAFMERIHTSKELRRRYASFTPTFRDNDLDYFQMAAQREAYNPFSRRSAMGPELSRADWHKYKSDAGAHKYRWTFVEPLFIDVFELTKPEGIHNINKIDVTINWSADIYKSMFSDPRTITAAHVSAATNTVLAADSIFNRNTTYGSAHNVGIGGTFPKGGQVLHVRYVTPSSRPKDLLTLPYIEYTRYNKITDAIPAVGNNPLALAAGSSVDITFDAIRETMVPRYGILVVKRQESGGNQFVADTMFRINSINIQVDNMQGILSTASPQQLWQMSTRNGLDVSWNEWYRQGQSIVIFEFGEDIGGLVPNVVGQFNMLVTVNVTNHFAHPYKAEAELFLSKDGFLEITPNEMRVKLGIMRSDIDLAVQNDNLQATEENDNRVGESMEGAGFKSGFRKFRKFAHTTAKGAAQGVNVASKLAGLAVTSKALMGSGRLMN